MVSRTLFICLGAATVFVAKPVAATERISGPVSAIVTRVLDGDTLEVNAHLWLGLVLNVHVRIRGIDAPETHQPQCASEKAMGLEATKKLIALAGNQVSLADIENDKYGGRVDAKVTAADGTDIGAAMIATGLAHPYDGTGQRADWCAVGSIIK
jgi:micrococcal nuclease